MEKESSTASGNTDTPESQGQSTEKWTHFWDDRTPDGEFKFIDNLYLRPWIVKYTPRFGKSVEAGCGMAAYVFYLRRLGIDIEGLEFSTDIVDRVNAWQAMKGLDAPIRSGDVTHMPHEDNSLAGYLSFGVVEHFEEGPMRALNEAFRVLRPGGIAIVTTPAPGYGRRIQAWRDTLAYFRYALKCGRWKHFQRTWQSLKLGSRTARDLFQSRTKTYINKNHLLDLGQFWQYEYKPSVLRKHLDRVGFSVIWSGSTDLRFNEYSLLRWRAHDETDMKRLRRLDGFESTPLVNWGGAFAVTVAVKVAPRMHCFLCGELNVEGKIITVPICKQCESSPLAHYYTHSHRPELADRWVYNPPKKDLTEQCCASCNVKYVEDPFYEDSGFLDPICPDCLKEPHVNIRLSNERLKLVWRPRQE